MRNCQGLAIFLLIGILNLSHCFADIVGKVVRVTDGDTIVVLTSDKLQVKVRLAAIDAPESGQEYGHKSKEALAALVAARMVTVRTEGEDRYGRTIGWVQVGDVIANREMIRAGWAWHFLRYNDDVVLAGLQVEAQKARRGLWSAANPPISPWDYRALKRGDMLETKVGAKNREGMTTSYWINSNGVRHNSTCRWFGNTKRGHYGEKDEGSACGQCGG